MMNEDIFVLSIVQDGKLGTTMTSEDAVKIFSLALSWYDMYDHGSIMISVGTKGFTSLNHCLLSFDLSEEREIVQEKIEMCVYNYRYYRFKEKQALEQSSVSS